MLWTSRPGAARRILNNPEYVVAIITASLVGSTALAKNFKDQQIILVQPVPPKYKTLASNAVLEFEPFNQYRRLEELGLAITQELQKGQLRVVGRADPAQLRLRVRLSAYLPARTGVRNAQENRSIEVTAGNSWVCQDRLTPVSYEEGGGQLAGSVTVDEGAHKAVYTAAIGVTYSFSWIRSVNNRNVQPGDADPCSGFFGIARRAYQDIYSSSPALSTPEIEAELRKRFAKEVASVLVKTDREIALRLSAEEKLAPANLFLVTRRWDEAVNTVPPCERGVPRGDCLYTRALAREGAVYAGFLADPTPEQAREARAALMQAVADYEGALSADSRERVIAANAARVRTLLVEWEKFVDYTAWMRTATPPENLPDRNPVRVTAAPGASKDGTGGDRHLSFSVKRRRAQFC
jgi:hypothetical protein